MKKLLLLLVAAMLIAGCSSEFYKHDSLFKTISRIEAMSFCEPRSCRLQLSS